MILECISLDQLCRESLTNFKKRISATSYWDAIYYKLLGCYLLWATGMLSATSYWYAICYELLGCYLLRATGMLSATNYELSLNYLQYQKFNVKSNCLMKVHKLKLKLINYLILITHLYQSLNKYYFSLWFMMGKFSIVS